MIRASNLFLCFILLMICETACKRGVSANFNSEEEYNHSKSDYTNQALKSDTIIFAGGCFWCTEAQFNMLKGVREVMPGYIGGKNTKTVSYSQVVTGKTGHAEAVMVVFDPDLISFDVLLQVFFAGHDPTQLNRQGNDIGTQYRSAIFVKSKEQYDRTKQVMTTLNKEIFENKMTTELANASKFFPAEKEHQKYYERNAGDRYCQIVITPKLDKIKKIFKNQIK